MAQGGRRVPRLRRGAAADSGQPARDGAHEQRQGRRIVSRQRGQLRHLPHRFPQRNRQIFARNDHEVDVPLRGRRRCRGLLPAARGRGLRRARAPDMGRNRLRGRLLDLPLLLHGADRTALPAAHCGVDVQLRTTRRGGAFLGRNRSRLLRVHQGRGGPVRLRRGLAGDQIQIAGAGGGGSGHEKG